VLPYRGRNVDDHIGCTMDCGIINIVQIIQCMSAVSNSQHTCQLAISAVKLGISRRSRANGPSTVNRPDFSRSQITTAVSPNRIWLPVLVPMIIFCSIRLSDSSPPRKSQTGKSMQRNRNGGSRETALQGPCSRRVL